MGRESNDEGVGQAQTQRKWLWSEKGFLIIEKGIERDMEMETKIQRVTVKERRIKVDMETKMRSERVKIEVGKMEVHIDLAMQMKSKRVGWLERLMKEVA